VRIARAALVLLLLGPAAHAQGEDAATVMAQLESRVLSARRVSIEATIESRGFIASKLQGKSEWLDRNRAKLAYAGTFAGQATDVALTADGRALQMQSGAATRREVESGDTNRALLIGLLRMGALHNLARLTGLKAPDHAEGGVEQWVTLDSFRPTTYAQGGDLEGAMSFGFDMVVAGQTSGSVRLWLDAATGLPRRRQVTVRFPQGEMTVVEDYTRFVVE
jgi:hypothetical protein